MEARVKDAAPGAFVRAEAWRQSKERPQGWSSWIWTGKSVSSHCVSRVLGTLSEEATIKKLVHRLVSR